MKTGLYILLAIAILVTIFLFMKSKKEDSEQTQQANEEPTTAPQPKPQKATKGGTRTETNNTPVLGSIAQDVFNISDEEKEAFKNKTLVGKLLTFNPWGYALFTLQK